MRAMVMMLFAAAFSTLAAACTPLSAFNTFSPKDPLPQPPVLNVAYGEGARGKADVYPAAAGAPAPTVIFIYGGSWANGRRQDYRFAGRALAAQGFLTIIPDYRLVPEVRFPGFVEDCARAVRWARDNAARYGGDPDRIFLMGHSAGAYNAMMLALDARYLDAVGVPRAAIRGAVGLAGPYRFPSLDSPVTKNAFGAAPDPESYQTVNFVRADAPPLLLLHGETDTVVRPRNALGLTERMQAAGGRATAKIYPGVDHSRIMLALSVPFRDRAPTLADATSFMREHAR